MPNEPKTTAETCPICDGSGMSDQMLSADDPANGPCSVCGGDGVLPVFDETAFEREKDESRYGQPTKATIQRHPLNAFADRWELDGDCIRCRHCNRPQQVTWALHDFPHASGCRNEGTEVNPWKSLSGLITASIMRAKEPT